METVCYKPCYNYDTHLFHNIHMTLIRLAFIGVIVIPIWRVPYQKSNSN